MQLPTDPSFIQQLSDSLQTFALDRFWQWILGFVVSAMLARVAYVRGIRGPALYVLAGAALGIGSVVGATALLIWSRPVFYGAVGVLTLAGGIYGALRFYRREQARLQGHPKGLIDYKKDLNAAFSHNQKYMSQLTGVTEEIGARSEKITTKIQSAQTEAAQEAVLDQAARAYRSAAVRYRRHAEAAQRSHSAMFVALSGVIGWLEETHNQAQLQEYRPIIDSLRTSIVSARENTHGFRDSVAGMPGMSQRLNASRAELVQSIDISISFLDSATTFSDQMLERLPA